MRLRFVRPFLLVFASTATVLGQEATPDETPPPLPFDTLREVTSPGNVQPVLADDLSDQ